MISVEGSYFYNSSSNLIIKLIDGVNIDIIKGPETRIDNVSSGILK
jgi:hypothetical protein